MSAEQDKIQHSSRMLKNKNAVNRQLKIARAYGVPVTVPHKLEKKHAMNCGDPKCSWCMNPRRRGEKTIGELRAEQDNGWTDDTNNTNNEDNNGSI